MPTECYCGTAIPEEGTDFEPTCRHCQRLHDARLWRDIAE